MKKDSYDFNDDLIENMVPHCNSNTTRFLKANNTVTNGHGFKVILTFDQLDIESGYYEKINKVVDLSSRGQVEVELSPRSFVNRDDFLGLIQSNPIPETRLGMEGRPLLSSSDQVWPNSLKLQLADVQRGNDRQVYSVMAFLSDFGGFNEGIMFLPAILMTLYNSKMFHSSIATLFPVKHRH